VSNDLTEPDLLRAAFRDLHGARLYGFSLLVAVGDRTRAAQAASTAVTVGAQRAAELRHPERAAAWLRRRVLKELQRTRASRHVTPADRHAALVEIGTADAAIAALENLTQVRRAALVAGLVERFALTDVATILGTDLSRAQRALAEARREYLTAVTHWMQARPKAAIPGGALADRIEQVAARAVGPRRTEA
jgi:DNA-directed RNA polymerase specialized sigma24 family protein